LQASGRTQRSLDPQSLASMFSTPITQSPIDGQGMFPGQSQKVVAVPMQQGICTTRWFDPVYSAAMPLEYNEFAQVIDELNGVVSQAFPMWMRVGPLILLGVGFISFALGGFLAVQSQGKLAFVPIVGFMVFGCGMVSLVALACTGERAMSNVRRKLSEFNARYQGKCDFQLYEQQHLQLYHCRHEYGTMHHGHIHGHGGGMRVRTVKTYTLVVQAIDSSGGTFVPAPDVLAAQALRQYAPTAPPASAPAADVA